jgi:hypothetical protein
LAGGAGGFDGVTTADECLQPHRLPFTDFPDHAIACLAERNPSERGLLRVRIEGFASKDGVVEAAGLGD